MPRLALFALGFVLAVIVANMIVRSFSKGDTEKPSGGNGKAKRDSNVIRPFPNSTPAATDEDATDKLLKLKHLHDSGVLTDEEFSQAKAKVLQDI
jgi:hypothetical protein